MRELRNLRGGVGRLRSNWGVLPKILSVDAPRDKNSWGTKKKKKTACSVICATPFRVKKYRGRVEKCDSCGAHKSKKMKPSLVSQISLA
ncbi:hypothetical protein CEXT_641701 [Caerostris extrusa]|uniref:Uncharacterized protein n=1 Tax=Caerostris extrusa TaxID=172846 RepID=A0AAV4TLS5_CAEEX|nr:hypothetical protein CEXT_641701 [Caerostris extrusa]